MSSNQRNADAIIIGIDFGTTYSGVAWAYSREPGDIEVITNWNVMRGSGCADSGKVPTQIDFGSEGTTWGFGIPLEKDGLRWFKLFLLEESDLCRDVSTSSQLHEARRLMLDANKSTIDTISAFLLSLWHHSIDNIKRSHGAEWFNKCKLHVVITMPAVWPHYAQQQIKRAAEMSGILDRRSCGKTILSFVSEPEAAALATLKDLSKRSVIKRGDTIVVCDAGGGTVDLISYVIESVDPFSVKECVQGEGGLCGAVFLDEGFINLIKQKVSPNAWDRLSKQEQKKFLNDEWEDGIKQQFTDQQRRWLVELPEVCGEATSGIKRRRAIDLSSSEIALVFSPIIQKIQKLVASQVQAVVDKYTKPPKYIILAGGFGRSRHLFQQLEATYPSTVLQSTGNKPWTAVCRGAVTHGLTGRHSASDFNVSVRARIARMSYGVEFRVQWVEGKYLECDKVWGKECCVWEAGRQMDWFLTQGDDVNDKEPVCQHYTLYYDESIDVVETEIFCSSVSPPPSRQDETVFRLCTMRWAQHIKRESLRTWTNKSGKVYHLLEYVVKMTCENGTVEFSIYHKGKRVSGKNVEVVFD
ncbi:hypothetical protein QQZ08_007167 [Neonectria magnoliae]|uniref:Actin-like ATPase domain-containing protein n=1 Tax=Neonectria magnoliae TaxID=2732573 RepID=A0ABR1I0C2_9HYPO